MSCDCNCVIIFKRQWNFVKHWKSLRFCKLYFIENSLQKIWCIFINLLGIYSLFFWWGHGCPYGPERQFFGFYITQIMSLQLEYQTSFYICVAHFRHKNCSKLYELLVIFFYQNSFDFLKSIVIETCATHYYQ